MFEGRARAVRLVGVVVLVLGAIGPSRAIPVTADTGPAIVDLSVGWHHACAVTDDGQVWCWGSNTYGQGAPPAGDFVSVSAGTYHTCGIKTDDTIACWGHFIGGAHDAPAGEYTSVSVGQYDNCAIRASDAAAVCWDHEGVRYEPPDGEFATISMGADHACGLTPLRRVVCWGGNSSGQAPPDVEGTYDVVRAGGGHTCALNPNGVPTCWGNNFYGQATATGGPYADLSLGAHHSCGLAEDGSLTCWGYTLEGQTDPPRGPWVIVDGGHVFDCGVADPHEPAVCWGADRAPYILPEMETDAPENGTVGSAYSHLFIDSEASPARTFAVTSGTLPPGLQLEANELIGTPATPGTFADITVTAANGVAPTVEQTFTIVIEPAPPDPSAGVDDIDGHRFEADIRWLYANGITTGCAPDRFCPDARVTRGQAATLLTRALDLEATSTNWFTDDEHSAHEDGINRLREAGITTGCGGTRYCPSALLTRAQLATLLTRALDLEATVFDYFTDDDHSAHEDAINRLRAAMITEGCAPTRFCPSRIVTRGQMAAFLHRALDD